MKNFLLATCVGEIDIITGLTYSYADSKRPGSTMLYLPTINNFLYVPESSIRGRWRHLCALMIEQNLHKQGIKLPLDILFWLRMGGVKSGGDAKHDVLMDRPQFAAHPFASFWGCSEPLFMERKVQIENALLNDRIAPDVVYGQRVDPVQRGQIGRDDVDDPAEFDLHIKQLQDQQAAGRKDGSTKARVKEAKASGTAIPPQPFNMPHSRQIIPPNSEANSFIDILNPTSVQVGMFLATLREFAKSPYFCARAGMNLGLVKLRYDITIDGEVAGEIEVGGRKRECTMSDSLMELEKEFWDEFPKMSFLKPKVKE